MVEILTILFVGMFSMEFLGVNFHGLPEQQIQSTNNRKITKRLVTNVAMKYLTYLYNGALIDSRNPYSDSLGQLLNLGVRGWGGSDAPIIVIDTFYITKVSLNKDDGNYEIKVKYKQAMTVENDLKVTEGRKVVFDSFKMRDLKVICPPQIIFTGREGMLFLIRDLMKGKHSSGAEELLLKLEDR